MHFLGIPCVEKCEDLVNDDDSLCVLDNDIIFDGANPTVTQESPVSLCHSEVLMERGGWRCKYGRHLWS